MGSGVGGLESVVAGEGGVVGRQDVSAKGLELIAPQPVLFFSDFGFESLNFLLLSSPPNLFFRSAISLRTQTYHGTQL